MEIFIMAAQLVLGLSLLVGLHELGHFTLAKLFGIRVDKFYIFFDFLFPISSERTFALFKKKVGGTEFGLGWLPLGGYVKIHGMVDETQNGQALQGPPEPDEFRGKPAWQRLLVMAGGIVVNLVLGIGIFVALAYSEGVEYLPAQAVPGVVTSRLGRQVGLRDGDRVVGFNGRTLVEFDQLYDPEVLSMPGSYLTVVRAGKRVDLPPFPASFFGQLAAATDSAYVQPRKPFFIGQVIAGDSAQAAGLRVGDRIRAVNEVPIAFFDEMARELARHRGQHVLLAVERAGQPVSLRVGVKADGKIGLRGTFELPTKFHRYSLAEALPQGADMAASVVRLQVLGLSKILRREVSASASMAGPVEIAQQFGGSWDWPHFWSLCAQLSMVLAFMNLLPIPGLDGGHLVFLLWEMASGQKPAIRVLQGAQRVGALLLLSLMMYVLVVKQVMKLF
jgi:regulator of sigma E protease